MNRSKNEILKVIFTRKNWRVKLEVEVLVEYLCQNMGGWEGVEINQVQEIETLNDDTTVIVMGVAVLKMLNSYNTCWHILLYPFNRNFSNIDC